MFSGSRSSPLARPWLGAFLLLWSSWLAVPAHAGDRSAAAAQQTPAALYHNYCSVCLGDNGDGQSRASGSLKPPPRDFTTPQAMQELTRERMLAAVKGGVPGTAMMAWKTQLNDAQIASVVDYVRDTFMRVDAMAGISGTHARGVATPAAQSPPPSPAPEKAPLALANPAMKLPLPQ